MHDILKKIMDRVDDLANKYIETGDVTKLTEFVMFRERVIDWILTMTFEKIIDVETAWYADIYISYVTEKVGCFEKHVEECPCIICTSEVQKFIDWRLAL